MILTSALIRERLADTELRCAPEDIVMPPGSAHWPASMQEQLAGTLKPAGVLVPIIEHDQGLSVLLTERSAELKYHAGQVSFPGGRMEQDDDDIATTALRETEEEVGIGREHISIVGYLRTMPTITGYSVTPTVGIVSPAAELRIDGSEVASAFEVPLAYLLDAGNDIHSEREFEGRRFPMIEFHWQGQRIWGATAFIILSLRKKLLDQ